MQQQKRLTTDKPQGNFEMTMNYVFDKDGEAFIRHDGRTDNVPLWQYIDKLCEEQGCEIESPQGSKQTDWRCCDCTMDGEACPVSMMYTFASQAVQLRGRLREYEDADEKGLLVSLPCKIGDKIYVLKPRQVAPLCTDPLHKEVLERIVVGFRIFVDASYVVDSVNGAWKTLDFGKTIFLTREEAEAALKPQITPQNE